MVKPAFVGNITTARTTPLDSHFDETGLLIPERKCRGVTYENWIGIFYIETFYFVRRLALKHKILGRNCL